MRRHSGPRPRTSAGIRLPGPGSVELAGPHSPLLPGRPAPTPSAIIDLETTALPQVVRVPARYPQALVLLRWQGMPLLQATIPVRDGLLAMAELRQVIQDRAAPRIARERLQAWLGFGEREGADPRPTMTVAVCTRDRPEDLGRCLQAIARLPDDGQEVVVVDSASRGGATREVVARHPGVRYVREERPGLDLARNRALAEARHEVVAFTDDDAAPDAGWLRALRRRFDGPRTLCVTGLTMPIELETPAQDWFERTNGFGRGFEPRTLDGARMNPFRAALAGAGVNMALRREVLRLIGPFDEALDAGTPTLAGGDHDMFARILAAGYRIAYEPAALVWHRHRREWSELNRAIEGYGTGVYAYLTRHLMQHDFGAPLLALGWLRWQLRGLWAAYRRRPESPPAELLLAELRGCLAGPGAYLRSRRRQALVRKDAAIGAAGVEA